MVMVELMRGLAVEESQEVDGTPPPHHPCEEEGRTHLPRIPQCNREETDGFSGRTTRAAIPSTPRSCETGYAALHATACYNHLSSAP